MGKSKMISDDVRENMQLLKERRPVMERVLGVPEHATGSGTKPANGAAAGLLSGIVGEVDKVNANRRVYTKAEWNKNLSRAKADTAGGMLGASDHLGCMEGGNLKNTAVVWKDFQVLADGHVKGDFVIPDTVAGRDLQAVVDAKGKVGFSTYGYAEGRKPTPAEREQYGMPPEPDEWPTDDDGNEIYDGYVVIENWDLIKIDAVDNPAVRTAWIMHAGAAASVADVLLEPKAEPVADAFDVQAFADNF
ncbi:MAG: hypothetical protein JWM57_294 [Phycisphaerales bacterium]|nr:hypothetical protein [Phycisphaerales bacterium]